MSSIYSVTSGYRALLIVSLLLVLPPSLMAEPSLWQIYNTIYGQRYVENNQELWDTYGVAYDEMWLTTNGFFVASARFAGNNQKFGYYRDSCSGSERVELFNVTESGYLPPGEYEAFYVDDGSGVIGLYLEPYTTTTPQGVWFSQPQLNSDAKDHLRTFRAPEFSPDSPEYLIAWEDLRNLGDADYNDLVLRIFLVEPYEVACRRFRLKYLHPEGADSNYHLGITTKEQTTVLDMNRHINSNDGSMIDITTNFSNAHMIKRGVTTALPQLNGPVCRTVMDSYGVISSVQPLGSTKERFDALNLTLERDVMSNLGISSFPERDLTVGSTWTKSGSKGNTQATFTYTIVEDEVNEASYNSVVKIKIESDFTMDETVEVVAVKKTDYIKGKVSVKGMLYFDLATGKIVRLDQKITTASSHIMLDFTGTATVSPNEEVVTTQLMIEP